MRKLLTHVVCGEEGDVKAFLKEMPELCDSYGTLTLALNTIKTKYKKVI